MQKQSIIILGHGSKSQEAVDDFNFVVDTLRTKTSGQNVFGAHMELAQPSLEEVVKNINPAEGSRIVVLPYFLFNGNHIKEDIPEKLVVLQKQYPQAEFVFGSPIGKEPMMADILLQQANRFLS